VSQNAWDKASFVEALRAAGVRSGDTLFSHSNVAFFGLPAGVKTGEAACQVILDAFREALGPGGTLVVPTFTYSFCKQQPFDVDNTPSTCGTFTEFIRRKPEALRSHDPIFSVAAIGGRAAELTQGISNECFGKGSIWHRLHELDALVCNLNLDSASTFIHYVERCLNVPYRFDKLFTGKLITKAGARKHAVLFFCQDLTNRSTVAAFERFHATAVKCEAARAVKVGRGAINSIRARQTFDLIARELKTAPNLLVAGNQEDGVPQAQDVPAAPLPANASMRQMIEGLWKLPRDIVSDGYDSAMKALAGQLPLKIHEYPTGTHCFTWIIPEKWTCDEACLETLDGRVLFSYKENPLHVVSYSLPYEGEVTRDELMSHLHVHPHIPTAVPFIFKYYERDWGLCCSRELRDGLREEKYRVRIKTRFSAGSLKVGEAIVKGATDRTIVLCAHLCHPAMVNDDLTGVVAGVEVMRRLAQRKDLRYTYRLLLLPETIGSVAWLSHNEDFIPKLHGGLFLEMLGLENAPALQMSFAGNTEIDQCFSLALKEENPKAWTGAFRTVIGNDERQFNAPGLRVPMLSLSRVLPRSHPHFPFREYHSSDDNPSRASDLQLDDACGLVMKMIDALEGNRIPENKFKGEIFCSRFALHIDFYSDPAGNNALFDVIYLIDGTRSIADIALACGAPFSAVKRIVSLLEQHDLVQYRTDC